MSEADRRFTRQVRPFARETVDSFSRRLLKANFETDVQQRYLIGLEAANSTVAAKRAAWIAILEKRTGRSTAHLQPHPSAWMSHPSGDGCERCGDTLPHRWICTLCSRGEFIEQNPHFDGLVCSRHSQWVGLRTKPGKQHHVADEFLGYETRFKKLRRKHRLDVQLYNALTSAVTPSLSLGPDESEAFPIVVQLAEAITAFAFARRFFDPRNPFADSLAFLTETVAIITPDHAPSIARAIWLNAMPAFWSIRNAVITGGPLTSAWAHDMPFPPTIVNWTLKPQQLDSFENFYAATGDDIVSVAKFQGRGTAAAVIRTATEGRTERRTELNICSAGHQFAGPPSARSGWQKGTPATCPQCRHNVVQPGYNDLCTTHPKLAKEFDEEQNEGYTARDITGSSGQEWVWRCEFNHNYSASAQNRTSGHSNCPYCQGKKVGLGINDLATTHPELVAEWDPADLIFCPPTKVSAGSKRFVGWICPQGHRYEARIWERVAGRGCPLCERVRIRNTENHLELSHPDLAAEWHPTMNGTLRPDERTAGSHDFVYWQCPKSPLHYYRQRIDRRASGYNCNICSRRNVVPGVNDLLTTEPLMLKEWHPDRNWKHPSKITAGTELRYWICLKGRHSYSQSVPNRRKTRGCPMCDLKDRILFDEL